MILIEWILEFLIRLFIEIVFEGIVSVFFRWPKKGFRYFKSRFHKRDE